MKNTVHQTDHNSKSSFSMSELRQVFGDWARNWLPIGRGRSGSQGVTRSPEADNPTTANRDAEFLGWQETRDGRAFALYNVMAEKHPLYRSTVTEKTLRKENLEIPPTPLPRGPSQRFDQEK
jgi:hypothetical protein